MARSDRPVSHVVRYGAAAAIALVLAAIAVYVLTRGGCGGLFSDGWPTSTGECLRVVESVDQVEPPLRDGVEKILDENESVAKDSRPYVKIALLTPLSVARGSESAMSTDQVRYSLEGAAVALRRANHSRDFGDEGAPNIQIVLVNQGSRQEYNEDLLAAMLDRGEPEHPLVAVVGLGSSFTGTELTAGYLADRGIPMVGATSSADSLTAERFRTLRNVSPGNTDYVRALRDLLDRQRGTLRLSNGLIVADQNEDPYVRTLRDAFEKELAPYVKFPTFKFTGGTVGNPATANVFDPVQLNICNSVNDRNSPLQMVFFAGRVADFRVFASSLAGRSCIHTPLAVLVGATGFHQAKAYERTLDESNVTVIYSSSADAPGWIKSTAGPPEGFAAFLDEYRRLGFTDDSLGDGYAIQYHDAVASAARAIRIAGQGGRTPKPADVNIQFGNLTGSYVVRGASGTLSFAERANGRAAGKVVVYRQVGLRTAPQLPPGLTPYLTR